MQLNLFPSLPPLSSSALTTSPSALAPIIGLRVQLSRGCRACGSNVATIQSRAGTHAARLNCAECGIHRGWMSAQETAVVTKIATTFGYPTTPIVIREGRHG